MCVNNKLDLYFQRRKCDLCTQVHKIILRRCEEISDTLLFNLPK